jgi:Tol biopolymer transport system component/tRNA A-37 threonylcarbamoyl transferase component Bud32
MNYIRMATRVLGHYELLDKLGEGGMGVVYKARDKHLDRLLAVKLLRADKVADNARKRRFVQEAKAASALNHPNIVTIYDIAEDDGSDFIAMELVPGRTLDQMIRGRGLPLGEALKCAAQIADAVGAAHAAGIIHRDLKPANVMVTDKGLVKVLDFGLAKLTDRTIDSELGETVTMGPQVDTEEGTILGTVAYMSPEQTEGKKLDGRSDIFSFGSLLYEMITGRRAFSGETKMSTLSAILREEPKPPSQVCQGVPREVERVISRCLRKDPARRFQHMDDLKVALEELKEESDSGAFSAAAPAAIRRRTLAPWLAAAAIALVIGAAWWLKRGESPTGAIQVPALRRLTSDPGLTTEPALSPDGKLVAYASDRGGGGNLDIWVQQLAGGEPIRLTHDPADDREPSFSPDGSKIAFRSDREGGGIYVVSTLGGAEQKIAEHGKNPRFSPDGKSIVYWAGERGVSVSKVYIVASTGGPPIEVHRDLFMHTDPIWSPDGKYLLFAGSDAKERGAALSRYDWFVASLKSGSLVKTGAWRALERQKVAPARPNQVAPLPVPGIWAEGQIVFSATRGDSRNIWQIPIAPETFQISGDAQRLTSGTGIEGDPSLVYAGPGGKTPRLVFSSLTENGDIWSVPMDTNHAKVLGEVQRLTQDVASDIRPSISGDGTRMVFNSNRLGNWDVWIKDLRTGKETALASTPADELNPKISLDGSTVVYAMGEAPPGVTYAISADGGIPRKVCDHCYAWPPTADGKRMPFSAGGRLWMLDIPSGKETDLGPLPGSAIRLSWDDRWITFYRELEPGHTKLLILPIRERPVTDQDLIEVTDGSGYDIVPEFSPDGNVLYFFSERDSARCLWAQRLDPATKRPVGSPFPVQHFHSARLSTLTVKSGQRALSVARDKIVLTMDERLGNIWMADSEAR